MFPLAFGREYQSLHIIYFLDGKYFSVLILEKSLWREVGQEVRPAGVVAEELGECGGLLDQITALSRPSLFLPSCSVLPSDHTGSGPLHSLDHDGEWKHLPGN